MKKNIGLFDRALRFVVGIAFILVGYTTERDFILEMMSLAAGIYLVFTALFETCLVYSFLGLRTLASRKKQY